MADPLSVIGGVAAGLQLVSAAAQALLSVIKLTRDLKEIPGRLMLLLNEVDDSINRLCSSCNAGSEIFQKLNPLQMNRLARCAGALHPALQSIHGVLEPLLQKVQGGNMSLRHLWKSLLYLKIEKELPEKLQRLNRLNIELIRELGVVGLETNLGTRGLVIANNEASSQGFTNLQSKMDSLQRDFRSFTLSIDRASRVTSETLPQDTSGSRQGSPIRRTESDNGEANPSTMSTHARDTVPGTTSSDISTVLEEPRVPQERAEQMMRYLANNTSVNAATLYSLSPPSQSLNTKLNHILISLRTFYTAGNISTSTTAMRTKFWEDTDTAIYLMKISHGRVRGSSQSQTRAFRLLRESTADASNELSRGTAIILVEILSTLSPVNTITCAYVREGMLGFLLELARQSLPTTHPIRIVLNELKNDGGDKNITLRALTFLVERLRGTLGPMHELSRLSLYRLCGLLRRGGDFNEALRVANEGIRAIRAVAGPRSLEERWLSRQLEHVYMDQEDWVAALSVCFEIVGQQPSDVPGPDPSYHDECAVMTMEDIAKTCECAGNIHQAIAWLKQASLSGSMVWGQTEALAHIHDKLEELSIQIGQQGDNELFLKAS